MAVSKENQTVGATFSKETIKMLDDIAKSDDRSRGYIIAKIVTENIHKYLPKAK